MDQKFEKVRKSRVSNPRNRVLPPARVTEREYEYVQKRAAEENLSISDYIRACILPEDFL